MVNISVSLQFFKWSTGKPGNEIPSMQDVQVCKSNFPRALSFPSSSGVYRQITGFTVLLVNQARYHTTRHPASMSAKIIGGLEHAIAYTRTIKSPY